MGTVYKIRQEVKDFIISTRKNNPHFSCRILAELVANKFHITISKSYVNTILKKAKLNGPVGRKTLVRRNARRFIIPKEKKEQIFRSIQHIDEAIKSKEDSIKKEQLIQRNIEINDDKEETKDRCNYDIPDDIFISIKTARTKRINLRTGAFRRMGSVFLRAAEWDATEYAILGKMIFRYIQDRKRGNYWNRWIKRIMQNGYRGNSIFNPACISSRYLNVQQQELYLGALCGVLMGYIDILNNKVSDRLSDYGLYTLNGIQKVIDIDLFAMWLKKQIIKYDFIMEYLKEKDSFFKDIAGIEINLCSGERIFLDITKELKSVQDEEIIRFQSIKQTLSMVSKQIIANTDPIVFYSKIDNEDDYNRFCNIISAFENISGNGINSVALCDNNRQILVDFNIIPKIKRKFILGISWIDKNLSSLFIYPVDKQSKIVYLESIDKLIWFYEDIQDIVVSNKREKINIRRIYIDKYNDIEDKMIILTNDMDNKVEKIIEKSFFVMLAHSNNRKKIDNKSIGGNNSFLKSSDRFSLWDIVIDYTNTLIRYSKNGFMSHPLYNDETDILQECLDLSGFIYEGNKYLSITLIPPVKCQYIDYLNMVTQQINSRNIYDFYGRKLYIDIEE